MFKNITKTKKRDNIFSRGFTLVEAMFAIFILTFVIVGLMSVVSSSIYSSRYAGQEIVVNFLMQETADRIRNDRDNRVFWGGETWDSFVSGYENTCKDGCVFNIDQELESCNPSTNPKEVDCATLYFNENDEVLYSHEGSVNTGIKRFFKVYVVPGSLPGYEVQNPSTGEPDIIGDESYKELKIEIIVYWLGKERKLEFSLLDWREK
jgi:Tfp pilus assembly protein PilV